MTWNKALRRVAATALQAAAATVLLWLALLIREDGWEMDEALIILVSAFAVPVVTAIQRLSQAWLDRENVEDEGYIDLNTVLVVLLISLIVLAIVYVAKGV